MVLGVAIPVRCLGLLFLEVTTIGQENGAEVTRGRGAVDWPAEAVFHEQGKVATVVEMGVRENHGIERGRREWEWLPIPQPKLLEALKETTIDQKTTPLHFNEVP
jgi:hypothetical protein